MTEPRPGRVSGKVALITGGARGQGRSHAVKLAEEGADVIVIDIAAQIDAVQYPMSTESDLAETALLVEKTGGRCVAIQADVRDIHALDRAVRHGVAELGHLDIVIANAGILPFAGGAESLDQAAERWAAATGVLLTGVFNTIRVTEPILIEQNTGGCFVLIGSSAGLIGMHDGTGGLAGYAASKHGLVGLMRGYAKNFGPHNIRINVIHPSGVASPMVQNEEFSAWIADRGPVVAPRPRLLPVDLLDVRDVTAAIMWLVSDDARHVTGINLPVDAGVSSP